MILSRRELQQIARHCVRNMGDIFWDARDFPENGKYRDTEAIAINALTETLTDMVEKLGGTVEQDCHGARVLESR
jgi:hypothetical protein